ncbi:MAG: efflux RND transporter periplasmic adaptor subunit [Alphaproteobacteria bacterium]|nr:efflux RND transporter periplasmic adaptor subunit [Alphaproteobacteria bacterium]
MIKKIVIIATIGAIAWYGFSFYKKDNTKDSFITHKLSRGNITEMVSASGTINPISSIDVGTQVSGRIQKIYVDYNSIVKKDQLLAEIDPSSFESNVAKEKANLDVAKAQVMSAKAARDYYKKHLARISKLNKQNYSADKELDEAQRDYDTAVANVALHEAQVEQAQAALDYNKIQLGYTKIISPVDGIIVSKSVEEGQTVAASFETPTLFNVAEDLTKMQIEATVVEADISKVKEGQKVLFNVDSFPNETFEGIVTQVRNEAVTTSNVVTYEVVISVNNLEHKFKPGMTANVEIITANEKDILVVPNKALRFSMGDDIRYQQKGVWILKDGKPQRINVVAGVYDDNNTQITSNELHEGTEIIVEKADTVQRSGRKMPMRMR